MRGRFRLSVIPVLAALGTLAESVPAQNADISTLLPLCEACHGKDGLSLLPTTPIIAGIDAGIIADTIYAPGMEYLVLG